MTVAVGVVSPLTLAGANAEHLLMACEWNLPVVPMVCPSAGTTSPYSLASTLLQANAETVFVAALTQMVRPGNPVQYATGLSVAEMTTGADRYYSIDKVLWKTAAAQLGLSYNLPTGAEFGGTLNPRYDVQSGAEGMLFALSAYASGAHLLCGLGSCYNAIGISAEMMIIQTAWLEVAKFLGRGIETDDARLGLESLTKGGPGACFLADDLTLRFLRGGEFFCSELFDFTAEPGDGEPMLVRAHNKVEELLTSYRCPVPEKVREDIHCYFGNLYEQVGK
jgi:trimethylamine--corrinoid protein Co-methyltransferase